MPANNKKSKMGKAPRNKAYAKRNKMRQKNKRKPFVECKTRSMLDVALINRNKDDSMSAVYFDPLAQQTIQGQLTYNQTVGTTYVSGFTNIPLRSFTRMSQGFRRDQMVGDAVFSRSLALRTEFEFPYDIQQITRPYSVYLVCGWVTQPTGFNNNTDITDQGATLYDVEEHISQQVKEYFDAKRDMLKFEKKVNNNLKILHYKKIEPDRRYNTTADLAIYPGVTSATTYAGATTFTGAQSGAQQFGPHSTQAGVSSSTSSGTTVAGSLPHVRKNFTWNINRKIHYTQGKETATGTDGDIEDIQNMYPNNQWLPFACVYTPDYLDMKGIGGTPDRFVKLRYNVQHRFSDS